MDKAISVAESLSNFITHDQPKSYKRRDEHSEKGGGDGRGSRQDNPRTDENGTILENEKPPYSKGFKKNSSQEQYEGQKRTFNLKGGCYVYKGPTR